MKPTFNFSTKTFTLFFILLGLFSCTPEEIIGSGSEEEETVALTANLLECTWISFSQDDSGVVGLRFAFTESSVEVKNDNDEVVDEGSYQVSAEGILFEGFSGAFEGFNGSFDILEDRNGFLEIGNSELTINFEQGCS